MILFLLCSVSIFAEKIKNINIEGNIFYDDNILKKVLSSKTGKIFERIKFKEDKDKLISFYRSNGFWDFRITKFDYRSEDNQIFIDISVEEDYITVINEVKIFGNEVLSDEQITSILNVKKNSPINYGYLANKQIEIMDKYASLGYIYSDVNYEYVSKENKYRIILFININEGKKAYIRNISGDSLPENTRNVFINEIGDRKGELYTPENMYLMQQKVYYTGIYSYLAFKSVGMEDKSESLDIYFVGTERKKNWVSEAVLYQFPNAFKISTGWGNDNLFNDGEKISVEASGAASILSSPLRLGDKWVYTIIKYKIPYVLRNLFSINTQLGFNYEINSFYNKRDIVVKAGISKTFNKLSIFNNYSYKLSIIDTNVDELSYRYERVTTNSSDITFYYDSRDNVLYPTNGFYSTILTEYAGGIFRGYNNFTKYMFDLAGFKTFFNAVTLAYRLKSGVIFPFGDSSERGISISEQFKLGGLTSIRGVETDSLGPLNALGTHSGKYLINGNFEMRVFIYKFLGMTYFFDSGALYEKYQTAYIDDFTLSAGLGLFANTLFGNIRIDAARPLSRDGYMKYYFSIGNPF